jgi:hypothetical protein
MALAQDVQQTGLYAVELLDLGQVPTGWKDSVGCIGRRTSSPPVRATTPNGVPAWWHLRTISRYRTSNTRKGS